MKKMSFNRCKDIHKFGNKYLTSEYKTQVEFFGEKSASYGPRNTVVIVNVTHEIVPHNTQVCCDTPQLIEVMRLYLIIHNYMVVLHNS